MSYPESQEYLLVDPTECAGCYSCMMACSLAHEGKENLSLSRIQVVGTVLDQPPDDLALYQCRQCTEPACLKVCPTGALHIDTAHSNIRTIDEDKCSGCKKCIQACPYLPHRIIWNHEKKVAIKCDLCVNAAFWDSKTPACISVCPSGAISLTRQKPSQQEDSGYRVDLFKENADQRGWHRCTD